MLQHGHHEDPPLIGRAAEWGALQRFVEHPEDPVLLVAGARGSGRSRLLHDLHRLVPGSVSLRSRPAEARYPYSGLSAVLAAAGVVLPPAVQRSRPPADSPVHELVDWSLQVLDALAAPAGAKTLLLVDDLDRQDDRSQFVLAFLAERLGSTPFRLVAAVRAASADDRFDGLPVVELERLDDRDVRRIGAALPIGLGLDAETLDLMSHASSGSPGALVHHLRHLTSAQRAGDAPLELPLPPAFRDEPPMDPRGVRTDATADRALRFVSTAAAVSAQALTQVVPDAADAVSRLVAEGLLTRRDDRLSIPSPEMRSWLYWGMSSHDRKELHAALAEAELEADPDLHLWHVAHTDRATVATGPLYAAAVSMLQTGLHDGAIEMAERALASTSSQTPAHSSLDFARILAMRGDAGLALRHLPHADALLPRREHIDRTAIAHLARRLTGRPAVREEIDATVGRYREELPAECAELLARVAVFDSVSGALDSARRRIGEAEALAAGPASPSTVRHWAFRLLDAIDGLPARRSPRSRTPFPPESSQSTELRFAQAVCLSWEEQYESARTAFAMLSTAHPSRRSAWFPVVLAAAAGNDVRAGDVLGAEVSIERLTATGYRTARSDLLRAWLAETRGRFNEASDLLDEVAPLHEDDRSGFLRLQVTARRASIAFLRGDLESAATAYARVLDAAPELNPAVMRCHPDLVEVLWRADDREAASEVTRRFALLAEHSPSRWADLTVARCLALLAPQDAVVAEFEALLARFTPADSPLEAARTHACFAAAAERAGFDGIAGSHHRAALAAFERLGATGWSRLARRHRQPEEHGRHPAFDTLTDTELAVLQLARAGARNREIATSLFMSLRSVELRLTQIYRKFDAHSRAQLFALLPDSFPTAVPDSPPPTADSSSSSERAG